MTYIWPSDSFSDCYGQEKAFWEEVSQWQFWTRVEQRQRQEMSWLCVWQRGGVHSNIQQTETLEWVQVNRVSEQSWVLHYRTTTPRLNKLERLRQWCIVMTKATNNITVSQVQNFFFFFFGGGFGYPSTLCLALKAQTEKSDLVAGRDWCTH